MKTLKIALGVALCAVLLSFSFGGDRYVIKLGDQQLVEQFVTLNKDLPNVVLPATNRANVFSVHYSECGRIGTARKLTLKNADQSVLKVWQFADKTSGDLMEIPTSELLSAMTGQTNYLFYTSQEHKAGQKLISIARATSASK